ncbi:MAG: aminotransferase class I/II-fold pyridoxal phosphate-dependent enzyme, partial [Candidatus Bathyarchaeota archaeon]
LQYEEIFRLITPKTKAMIVNTPSNPTGAVFDETSLKHVAEIALENDLIVISDEAYEAITYDGFRHISLASLSEMKSRTISVFSLSKTYAMTGWRIGYALANPEITRQMIKLQEHLTAHPSSISQTAAVAALNGSKGTTDAMVKEYSERKELVVEELKGVQGIECFTPQGAFYVFPRIKSFNLCSDSFAIKLLEKARVVVVSGTAFGDHGEGHVRISYATSKDKIRQAMQRIRNSIGDL